MPTYMDIHDLPGVTPEAVAEAHLADLKVQTKHGVSYHKYWVNEKKGKVYCLCEAPTADAAAAVHQEAHGMTAARIMEVAPELADAFMGAADIDVDGAATLPGHSGHDPGTRTVLFTDIVGSTDMTGRLGDEAALAVISTHDRIVRAALASTGGTLIKHTGDGMMVAFVSAVSAVRCGIDVLKTLSAHRVSNPDIPLSVRIGLAAGEPIEQDNDLFGATVQLAARLCAHAEPHQILVSNVVAELCIGKLMPFEEIGTLTLKGFSEPVRAHALCVR